MIVRFFVVAMVILFSTSCYYLGCYSLSEACEECCKEAVKPLRRSMGGKRAWAMIEPCIEECIEFAESRDKDGYWVEDNEACFLNPATYPTK